MGTNPTGEATPIVKEMLHRRWSGYYDYLEQTLGSRDYLAGDDFTCADMMVVYNFGNIMASGGKALADLPNTNAYFQRNSARPAYQRAMQIAGPEAAPTT